MRSVILVVAAALVAGAVAAAEPAAIPREGTVTSQNVTSGALKIMPLGKDRLHVGYEVMGVSTGDGLLSNATMRCMGGMHAVNGAYEDESGSCVYTRPDGDQVFATHRAAGKLGATAKGTYTYVGGTGKLAGITGGGEFTRVSLRPAADGTTQSVVRGNGTYKLP